MKYAVCFLMIMLCACMAHKKQPCKIYELCLRGKEVTYHYAHEMNNGGVKYVYYIHVDKKGNVNIVSKDGKKYNSAIEIVDIANNKKVSIDRYNYERARSIGLKFENTEKTFYKKGDDDFQDALFFFFINSLGNPFLIEVGGESRNLYPILRREPSVVGNTVTHMYNYEGEELSGLYMHGINTSSLPTLFDSTGRITFGECKTTQ